MDGPALKAKHLRLKDFEILDSIERVKSMAHEERLAMVSVLTETPLTGTMVARRLGLPVARTHYHLQRLLKSGLIQEAGRGRKRRREERYYIATARNFLVHPRLACRDRATAAALERSAEAAFLDWRRREVLGIDFAAVARHIVHDSLRVRPGDKVLLFFGPPSIDLGETIAVELEASGTHVAIKHWSRNVVLQTLDRHTRESLATIDFVAPHLDRELDAVVFVTSHTPEGPPPNIEQSTKLPLLLDAVSRWHRSVRERRIRYLEISLPHRGDFEEGAMSPEEAVDLYWRCLAADPNAIVKRARALLDRMGDQRSVSMTGVGTDIEIGIDLKHVHLSDGVLSEDDLAAGRSFDALPAGLLALLPEPATTNGVFRADYTFVGGRHYQGVRVVLREGRIVELHARRGAVELRERLATAAGDANLIAQLSIGLNPAGQGTTGMPVLDPNLAGTVSLSFGNNELLGGSVRATLDLIMPATSLTVRGGDAEIVRRGILAD